MTPSTRSPGLKTKPAAGREAARVAVDDEGVVDLVDGEPGHPKCAATSKTMREVRAVNGTPPWPLECHGWNRERFEKSSTRSPIAPASTSIAMPRASSSTSGRRSRSAPACARTSSRGAQHPPRTASLVAEVADLETIVVETELEALMLEANFIKKEKPPYNVILRDDKNFPYLKLSLADEYPRVSLVRKARLDENAYYGPFLPASVARRSLKMIPRFFQVATCDEVFDGKRRPCLYYHLDQCLAPCAGKTDRRRSTGKPSPTRSCSSKAATRSCSAALTRHMQEASERQGVREGGALPRHASPGREARRAADDPQHRPRGSRLPRAPRRRARARAPGVRDARRARCRPGASSRSTISTSSPGRSTRRCSCSSTRRARRRLRVVLAAMPAERRSSSNGCRRARGERSRSTCRSAAPSGDSSRWSKRTRTLAFEARFRARHSHGVEVLEALAEVLGLAEAPFRIECFDISNIHGTDSVASMVVWENGKPKPSDYRIFNIKSVARLRRFRLDGGGGHPPLPARPRGGAAPAGSRPDRRRPGTARRGGPRARPQSGLPTLPMVSLAKREEEIYPPRAGRAGAPGPRVPRAPAAAADPGRGAPLRHQAPPRQARPAAP